MPAGETPVLCVLSLGSAGFPASRVTAERGLGVCCKSQGNQHCHCRELIANPSFVQLGLTSRHQRLAALSKSSGDCMLCPADGQQNCSVCAPLQMEQTVPGVRAVIRNM